MKLSLILLLSLVFSMNIYSESIQIDLLNEAINQYNKGLELEYEGKTVKASREKNESLTKIKSILANKTLTFPSNCLFKYSHGKLFNIAPMCENLEKLAFYIEKQDTSFDILEKLE